ncbi:hypothetical protein CAPTEDRAFT_154088, partial [Capitella teleta]
MATENIEDAKAQMGYDPTTNYDEATMAQQRQIEQEIAGCQPLIGKETDLKTLHDEYSPEDKIYQDKITDLQRKHSAYRRIRMDGNCFYRGFGFGYMEKLLKDKSELQRFKEVVTTSKDEMIKLGFPSFTIEDFHSNFIEVLEKLEKDCGVDELLEIFNDQGYSDYLVVYLRLLVSGHLQKNDDFFMNFIEGGRSVKEFCAQEVEPMGKESDHIHITALTAITGVPVCIEYMDRSEGHGVTTLVFPDDKTPVLTLLYKPGHYDLLY